MPDLKEYFIDLDDVTDKDSLMSIFKSSLGFPDYFGNNWDALYDNLTDPILLPDSCSIHLQGYEEFCQRSPEIATSLVDILNDVIEERKQHGEKFRFNYS